MDFDCRMQRDRDYFLFLADLKGSTKLTGSAASAVLAAAEGAIHALNAELDPPPLRGLSINYGDEIAGLFDAPNGLYDIVAALRRSLRGLTAFRFVVAEGRIGVAHDDITRVGGPVFKEANDALEQIKRRGRFCRWIGRDAIEAETLQALVSTSDVLLRAMTDYQHQVYLLSAEGLAQREIASRLGKYAQSVSDAVKRGAVEDVLEAERAIRRRLAARSGTAHPAAPTAAAGRGRGKGSKGAASP